MEALCNPSAACALAIPCGLLAMLEHICQHQPIAHTILIPTLNGLGVELELRDTADIAVCQWKIAFHDTYFETRIA